MKISKEKRLDMYLGALEDYKIAKRISKDRRTNLITRHGFCYYFLTKFGIPRVDGQLAYLPELIKQRPKKYASYGYWFSRGAIAPRIRALENAIALCKKKKTSKKV